MTAAPAKATSFMAEREGEKEARKIYGGSHSTTRAGERERIPECGLLMHRVSKNIIPRCFLTPLEHQVPCAPCTTFSCPSALHPPPFCV